MFEKQLSYQIDEYEGVFLKLIFRSGILHVSVNRFGLDWGTGNRLGRVSLSDEASDFETGRYNTLDKLKSAVCEYVSSAGKIPLSDAEDLLRGALDGVSDQS